MAKKKNKKKMSQTKLAFGCWILGFLILGIVFFMRQDDIYSNLKTTNFFERLFGSTPQFIEKHEVKEKPEVEEETVITLKTEEKPAPVEKQEIKKTVEKTETKKEEKPAVNKTPVENKPVEAPKTVEKPKTEEVKTIKTVNQNLYFVFIGEDGVLSRKKVVRSVEKNNSPLMTNLKLLLAGPNRSETEKGLRSLIPEGTKLLAASVKDGVAYLNFSEEFEFNSVGPDGYMAQLMQIVYTATEFGTVSSVQFLVEGQKKEYLGSEGVWIGSPLSRASF